MDKFEKQLVDLFEDEFQEIKASRELQNKIIKKNQKQNKVLNYVKSFWNHELEVDLRVCAVAIILIVTIPTVYVFNKAEQIKDNEIRIYTQNPSK